MSGRGFGLWSCPTRKGVLLTSSSCSRRERRSSFSTGATGGRTATSSAIGRQLFVLDSARSASKYVPPLITRSAKTDPATMRVQPPESGRRRRTLDEEKTRPRADRPQAAPGGPDARLRCLGPGGRPVARLERGELLPPPEEPLRQDESQRDQASQRSSKRRTPARRSSSPITPWASRGAAFLFGVPCSKVLRKRTSA